jgi:hypothetical protein
MLYKFWNSVPVTPAKAEDETAANKATVNRDFLLRNFIATLHKDEKKKRYGLCG